MAGAVATAVFVLPEALADMTEPDAALLVEKDRGVPGSDALRSERDPALLASTAPPGAEGRGLFPGRGGPSQPLSVVTQGVLHAGESLGPVLRGKGITPSHHMMCAARSARPLDGG